MALDEPSAQLYAELRQCTASALASRRPVLHKLNEDSSWLLQLPRPARSVRSFYNVLIDPWFTGGQSDVASWFSQQFHATESAIRSIAELEEMLREIERLALDMGLDAEGHPHHDPAEMYDSLIDVVTISHEFTDHCHKETLLQLLPTVPIFAAKEAAKVISGWKHFNSVTVMSAFGASGHTDWRSTCSPPLPEWVGISRMISAEDTLYYHSAVMIAFNSRHASKLNGTTGHAANGKRTWHYDPIEPDEDAEAAEAVVYTPHGINSADLEAIPKASPPITTLAFLHGLHNVRIGTLSGRTALQLNLGVYNGLKAQRILNAHYWCGTHDEIKKGGGLVSFFLQRNPLTLKDAIEQERQARKQGDNGYIRGEMGEVLDSFDDTNWLDLKNGESRILL